MLAYCLKCREKREMGNRRDETTRNGRPIIKGACPVCGSVVNIIGRTVGDPKVTHPRRTASPYLLSGLLTCQACGKALSAAEAKGGRYTYYVCHSLLKRGSGECTTPRINAKRFERLIVDQIREHILTESNMRDLVKMVNEEMDSVIREQQERVEAADAELTDIRRRMDRLWELVEKTDLTMEEILPRCADRNADAPADSDRNADARTETLRRIAGLACRNGGGDRRRAHCGADEVPLR